MYNNQNPKHHFTQVTKLAILLVLVLITGVFLGWRPDEEVEAAQPNLSTDYAHTFTVNDDGNDGDDDWEDGVCATELGVCTLRAAINQANFSEGTDLILFDPAITEIEVGYYGYSLSDETGGTTIRGEGNVKLRCNDYAFNIWSDHNKIQGLVMVGSAHWNEYMDGITVRGDHNVIGTDSDGVDDASEGNRIYYFTHLVKILSGNNIVAGNILGISLDDDGTGGTYFDGVYLGGGATGNLIGGDSPVERNVISRVGGYGVRLVGSGTTGNTVSGNYIGTNTNGNEKFGNGDGGVLITYGPTGNIIGGDTEAERNVISGSGSLSYDSLDQHGVKIENASENIVMGNYIGTNAVGDTAIPNHGAGVYLYNASDNQIHNNLISGNQGVGVDSFGSSTMGNTVTGNYIGVNAAGTAVLPNEKQGVIIGYKVKENQIGGNIATERNIISGNGSHGISFLEDARDNMVLGNYIGTDLSGMDDMGNDGHGIYFIGLAMRNTIGGVESGAANRIAYNNGIGIYVAAGRANELRGNAIFDNAGLGIDIDLDGVTPNDAEDGDTGANYVQNYPELTSVLSGGDNTQIMGSINSTPDTPIVLDFYASETCDDSGFGEGAIHLGAITVTTDLQGDAGFMISLPAGIPEGHIATATATAWNSTSEFSSCSFAQGFPAGTHQVNSTADVVDATINGVCDTGGTINGDPECTLRAAIQEANLTAGADLILLPAGTYSLTIGGITEEHAAQGDLDIRDDLQIVGAGAATTIIDANGLDRVFHVDPSGAGSQVTLSDFTIQNGTVTGSGAGIYNRGTLTLTQVIVQDNHALGSLNDGGGVYNRGEMIILSSTIYSNTVEANGGGLATGGASSSLMVVNSTFSGNQANSNGGGIYVHTGPVGLNNVTLTENVADSDVDGGDGGGIYNAVGTVTVRNTIIAQNTDNSYGVYEFGEADCSGTYVSGGYNMISDKAFDGTTQACNGFSSATNDLVGGGFIGGTGGKYVTYYAALGPLQFNGGSTPTHMPQRDINLSVIDKGNPAVPGSSEETCATTDQRGVPRPTDGDGNGEASCDRGAVEYSMPTLYRGTDQVAEGETATLTISLYPASTYTVTVGYVTEDNSAISISDYITKSGSLTFPPGITEQTVDLQTQTDSLDEDEETFRLALVDPSGASIAYGGGLVAISDDDPEPSLSINDVAVTEVTSGTKVISFTVSLSTISGRVVSVAYATDDETATDGEDYLGAYGTLTFDPGETEQYIRVTILSDAVVEADETFYVNLDQAANATIADAQGMGTITEKPVTDRYEIYLPLVVR
jgi:CSLREA domain-containing protein